MQQCYHPFAVCDVEFDRLNAHSDEDGNWPTKKPKLAAGTRASRRSAVFNDGFEGNAVVVHWTLRKAGQAGPASAKDALHLDVPCGEVRLVDITFGCPATEGDIILSLELHKDGECRFHEDGLVFEVVSGPLGAAVADGDYRRSPTTRTSRFVRAPPLNPAGRSCRTTPAIRSRRCGI